MDNRKDRIREYKMKQPVAGVFAIIFKPTGRALLGSSLNLDGPFNRFRFELKMGSHQNAALQADWNAFGEEAFDFVILETIEPKTEPGYNYSEDLAILEQIWIDRYQPFDEKCYNTKTKIRMA